MNPLRSVMGGLGLCVVATLAGACDRSPLLVRNVNVWSPDGIQRGRDVQVMEGRIHSIRPSRAGAGAGAVGGDARVIDGRGATMLPGFIDSHLHLSYVGQREARPGDHRWGTAVITGAQLLSAGVTSGRIHLTDLRQGAMLRADSQDDCAPLPRLQSAGPAFIPGTTEGYESGVWTVTSLADAADRVRRIKSAGFEWVAIHEAHKFSAEERDVIVRTTRELGLRLLASGYTQDDLASSLPLRPDTIDYIDVSTATEYAQPLIEAARAQPALIWVARLGVHARYHAHRENAALIANPLNYEFIPADERAAVRAAWEKEIADREGPHAKRMDGAFPTIRRKFQQLRESGIPLAAGTDAGSPTNGHREAIWWELRSWVDYGATPKQALEAVTVNGARVLHDDSIGAIRAGSRADFVLYRGDVARGEFDAGQVTHVAKGGVLFVRDGKWVGSPPP
jgi:imidazolonepropionase-like amidohydrolase